MKTMQAPTAASIDDNESSAAGSASPLVNNDQQLEIAAFLCANDSPAYRVGLPAGRPRESGPKPSIIETHAARLFLGERIVCKIKRAVRYSYLDMSTLEARRRLCERELELNRPLLPEIYIDVVSITRESDGSLTVDGNGEPIEWVLRMNRFEQRVVLDDMARSHRLTHSLALRLGRSIALFHEPLPRDTSGDGYARMREVVDELDTEFAMLNATLPSEETEQFALRARAALGASHALLDDRATQGFVRRCHGDLHLRNILLHDGEPVPFDALEFDERMATTDVLYDLAFLIMDLGHRGLHEAQNVVLNEYLLASPPANMEGLALLRIFLSIRAAVRAMTTAQAATQDKAEGATLAKEANSYLDSSLHYLDRRSPALVVLGGLSGSGKSTVARSLATRIASPPGAVLLGSDAERKRALGVEPETRLGSPHYTDAAAVENYRRLCRKASHALDAGFSVVLDATWLGAQEREAIGTVAESADVPYIGLWLDAPAPTLRRRIIQRRGDVSDATLAVLEAQLKRMPGLPEGWHRIEAGGEPFETLRNCLAPIVHARARKRLFA